MEKKKMIIILGSVVGVIVLVILAFVVFNLFSGGKQSYTQIEATMITAARNYYKDHSDSLPADDGTVVTVEASTLAAGGYMKELEKLNDNSCTGTVIVRKNGELYSYTSYLDCGEKYHTEKFVDVVKEKLNEFADDGTGLYSINNEYVYRGENPSNYVTFANATWRIVKIDSENVIELIAYNNIAFKGNVYWDDRYNSERNDLVGINDYKVSRIREKLLALYANSEVFSDSDRTKMVLKNLCVGKRSPEDTSKDGSIECATVLEQEPIALLTVYDYLNASLDEACVSASSSACQNYNYLSSQGAELSDAYWLLTASTENSYNVYRASRGKLETRRGNSNATIRPVIYLQSDIVCASGTGTLADPYVIK